MTFYSINSTEKFSSQRCLRFQALLSQVSGALSLGSSAMSRFTPELRSWCERAQLCVRCYLRFANPGGNSSYGGCARVLHSRHKYSPQLKELCFCAGCLGVLSDTVLDDVPRQARVSLNNIMHDGRYKINAALPMSAAHVRERALWIALRRDFPRAKRPHALREAFKLALSDRLSTLGLRYAAEAPLFVDVSLTHTASEREALFAVAEEKRMRRNDNHPKNKKNRKRSKGASTGVVMRVLESLDDSRFEQIVPRAFIPPPPVEQRVQCDVSMSAGSILLAGEYNKYSRVLSQTPWAVRRRGDDDDEDDLGSTITEDEQAPYSNVESVVTAGLQKLFRPERINFVPGGREDVDVRCLGNGRPFVVELTNPCVVPTRVTLEMLNRAVASSEEASDAVTVRNLRLAPRSHFAEMKVYESSKRKRYRCVVWTEQAIDENRLKVALEEPDGFVLNQKTPLRVLHRRSLLDRQRAIYTAKIVRKLSPQFFILDVEAQAGTYVKEFVHGDNGRTFPNVGSLLGCRADIIQLDVRGIKL